MTVHLRALDLEIAPENVRKSIDPAYIAKLAGNILANGLLQNLCGYVSDDDERTYITAGGNRLAAVKKLIADGEWPETMQVEVSIYARCEAVEISLAENEIRQAINPADRVRAFKKMHADGLSSEAIIAGFGISRKVYSNTMRIADLPDPILDHLAVGKMLYEHAAAYALGDPDKALEHFEKHKSRIFTADWHGVSIDSVRRAMTEAKMEANNRVAKYLGRAAYEKGGGRVTEDLFSDNVMFDDPELAETLAQAKLEKAAAKIAKTDGWAWVEAKPQVSWDDLKLYGRVYSEKVCEASEEEVAEYDALAERMNADEDMTEAEIARLDDIGDRLIVEKYTPEQKKFSGVILSIDHDGNPHYSNALVKPEQVEAAVAAGVMQADRHQPEAAPSAKDPLAYSAALEGDLQTIWRTAIQCELVDKPDLLQSMLIAHLGATFGQFFELTGYPQTRPSPGLIEQGLTPDKRLVEAWTGKTSGGTLATQKKKKPAQRATILAAELASRLSNAHGSLFKAHTPDLRKWWTPNAAFFARLTKAQLIEIVCEIGAGQLAGVNNAWDKYKKGDLCTVLAGFFDGTTTHGRDGNGERGSACALAVKAAKSWLPPSLRPEEQVKPGDDVDDTPDAMDLEDVA